MTYSENENLDYEKLFKLSCKFISEDNYDDSIKTSLELLKIIPKKFIHKVHYNLGFCYKHKFDFKRAEEHFLKSNIVQDYVYAKKGLFELYCYIGDWFSGYRYFDWNFARIDLFHYDYETSKKKRLDWEDPNVQLPISLRFNKSIPKISEKWSDLSYKNFYERCLNKIEGKILHIFCSQGLGDVIQCSYFLNDLLKYNPKKIILSVRSELLRVMCGITNDPRLVIFNKFINPQEYDYFIPSFSLIKLFKYNPKNLKESWINVLHRDKFYFNDRLKQLIKEIHGDQIQNKKIIGINWRGNPKHPLDHKRSMTLEKILNLNDYSDQILASFQFNPTLEEKKLFKKYKIVDLSHMIHDVYDMSCFLSNVSHLHSVDSAPIHLAGAMGIESTCYLVKVYEDPRWGFEGNKKIYKSVKIRRLEYQQISS